MVQARVLRARPCVLAVRMRLWGSILLPLNCPSPHHTLPDVVSLSLSLFFFHGTMQSRIWLFLELGSGSTPVNLRSTCCRYAEFLESSLTDGTSHGCGMLYIASQHCKNLLV